MIYKGRTTREAIAKAVRAGRSKQTTSQNTCTSLERQLQDALREVRRRASEFERLIERARDAIAELGQSQRDSDAAQKIADHIALVDSYALGPGTIHSIMRASDPGRFRPRANRNWYTETIGVLEGIVFPDRRARFARQVLGRSEGRLETFHNESIIARRALNVARDRAVDIGTRLLACQILNEQPDPELPAHSVPSIFDVPRSAIGGPERSRPKKK